MKAMPLLVQVRSASAVNSRRSASAVKSRRSASAVKSRPWQLAPLVLIKRLAHVRAVGGEKPISGTPTACDENLALLAKKPVFMRLCEQCHMAQFNGKWHSSNQRELFSLGVCFNNLNYKSIVISPNSATWHCSKTQVLCRFEPNSAIFSSSALGQPAPGAHVRFSLAQA